MALGRQFAQSPLFSKRIALQVLQGDAFTWQQLLEKTQQISTYLQHLGVKPQDGIALCGKNSLCAWSQLLFVPGGFGSRGVEGKICAARYARESKTPYLGICLGMQVATIEYARHKAGLKNANSTEFDAHTPEPVIALIDEWEDADGSIQKRDAQSDLGGTMRLGAQTSDVQPGTLAHQIYGDTVTERHRHRYEANTKYLDKLREAGLVISALTQREHLTEIIELPQSEHPWFIGVQFHPEFKSTPWAGHPLFNAFIRAAMQRHGQTA